MKLVYVTLALLMCSCALKNLVVPLVPDHQSQIKTDKQDEGGHTFNETESTEGADKQFTLPTVYFDFNQSIIKASEQSTLRLIADNAKNHCIIEGHADQVGDEVYNYALGLARAQAVQNYLINANVNAELFVISYGEEKPASNDDNLNRRVEVKCK